MTQVTRGEPPSCPLDLVGGDSVPSGRSLALDQAQVDPPVLEHHRFREDVKVQDEVDAAKWKFKDGTVETIKLEEHSYGTPRGYSSVLSQIRLFPITSGEHRGSTFVQWSAQFSGDAGVDVIEDARYKRRDALADLSKALAAGKGKARA
ncbi:hypothetical protein RHS01_06958 [Rhizoctonia solani]|uniref:Uncharacterized protein n=1 Tax=Rhizoctonia solani TaxID=456999 RepID=A0A8H7I7Y6_9AGAM|nr:hypothetical protein RHS01_06958 [Rhizoctonia solani]